MGSLQTFESIDGVNNGTHPSLPNEEASAQVEAAPPSKVTQETTMEAAVSISYSTDMMVPNNTNSTTSTTTTSTTTFTTIDTAEITNDNDALSISQSTEITKVEEAFSELSVTPSGSTVAEIDQTSALPEQTPQTNQSTELSADQAIHAAITQTIPDQTIPNQTISYQNITDQTIPDQTIQISAELSIRDAADQPIVVVDKIAEVPPLQLNTEQPIASTTENNTTVVELPSPQPSLDSAVSIMEATSELVVEAISSPELTSSRSEERIGFTSSGEHVLTPQIPKRELRPRSLITNKAHLSIEIPSIMFGSPRSFTPGSPTSFSPHIPAVPCSSPVSTPEASPVSTPTNSPATPKLHLTRPKLPTRDELKAKGSTLKRTSGPTIKRAPSDSLNATWSPPPESPTTPTSPTDINELYASFTSNSSDAESDILDSPHRLQLRYVSFVE
jgi:hypothetical protein